MIKGCKKHFKTLKRRLRLAHLVFETVCVLYICKILLVLFSFPTVRKLLKYTSSINVSATTCFESSEQIQMITFAIRKAQYSIIWKRSVCLVNALTAKYLLDRRKIPCKLYLGINKSERLLQAHAWTESEGRIIVGGSSLNENFTPLVCFKNNVTTAQNTNATKTSIL